jgi:hypothetical protein
MTNSSYLDQFQINYPVELLDCSIHNTSLCAKQTDIPDADQSQIGLRVYPFQNFPCFVPESQQLYMAAYRKLVSLVFFNGKSPIADKSSLQHSSTTSPASLDIDQIVDISGKPLPKDA